MSDESGSGALGWFVGISGAFSAVLLAIMGWVRGIDSRMTSSEASITTIAKNVDAVDSSLGELSKVVFETRDHARDLSKDLAVIRVDVGRHETAIDKLEATQARILSGIDELLRRTPR